MKKIYLSFLLVFLSYGLLNSQAISNYMINGDFETEDATGWNNWNNGIIVNDADVYQGNASGFIEANKRGSLQQNVNLKSYANYQMRATIKSEIENESINFLVRANNVNLVNEAFTITNTYSEYIVNFSTEEQTTASSISIWQSNASFSKKFIDNFEVVETENTPPQVRFSIDNFEEVQAGIVFKAELIKIPLSVDLGQETWSIINNTGSATVDQEGNITPLQEGKVTLRVSFDDYANVFAEKEITITQRSAQKFYLDAISGNDDNNGISENTPFKSLDKINNTALVPGDTILLKSGQEFFGKLIPSESGSIERPIVFGKYDEGTKPVINGKNKLMCINASGKENLVFNDLILKNDALEDDGSPENNATINRYGFYAHVGYTGVKKNITLNNIKIHKIYPNNPSNTENTPSYKGFGIVFASDGSGDNNYYDGITIRNCEITDIGSVGIGINKWIPEENEPENLYQKNITIENNNLHHIGGSGIVFFNVQNFLIQNNLVTYTGDYSLDTRQHGRGSGFWSVRCKDGIIQNNEFSHVRGAADSCGAHIDIENNNIIIQYNLSYDNAGGFAEFMGANTNCIYRYNISINDGFRVKWRNGATISSNPEMYTDSGEKNTQEGKIIWFSDFTGFNGEEKIGSKNNEVYNNSIYIGNDINGSPITSLIKFGDDTDYNSVKNNIFYVEPQSTLNFSKNNDTGINNEFSNNLYSNSGPSNSFFQGENDLLNTDPLFLNKGSVTVDDYKINDNSPAVDSGALIVNNGGQDYWGNSISESSPTDIGANELSTALSVYSTNAKITDLYPNPVKDYLYISSIKVEKNFKIYNVRGQEVKVGKYNDGINVSNLKKGIYILKLENNLSKIFVKK